MEAAPDSRLSVLLVDDHAGARTALAARLRGHALLALAGEAGDLDDALAIVDRARPHVVLIDPVRADDAGIRLVEAFAAIETGRRPLVAVHVSYFVPDVWERARDAGAHELVLKQTDLDALATVLIAAARRVLDRRRWPAVLEE